MSYCSQAVIHIWCIVERVTRLPGQNHGAGTHGAVVRRRGALRGANGIRSSRCIVAVSWSAVARSRKLNLHCLLGSMTYLTQMEEHGCPLASKIP